MDVILVAAVVIAITVAAVLLLRRVLARRGTRQSERAGRAVQFLIGVIGAYYGLLTGFTLSGVWAKAEFVRGAVMVELNALTDLRRIALELPPPEGRVLADGVGVYLTTVIEHDIDAMAGGRLSDQTTAAFEALWSTALGARATDDRTARLAERALDAVQSVGEQRSIRYLSSTQSVPPIIWAVLILGAAVILYGSTLASFRYAGASLEILIGISIMLSAVLVAIYTLDRPFGLGAAATTTNYERLRDLLEVGERRTGSAGNVHPYMTSGSSGRTDKESPT